MKHTLKISFILVILFLLSHLIGLFIVSQYSVSELPYGIERPELEEGTSYIPLLIAIMVATGIALLLIRFKAMKVWKIWFAFATVYLLSVAFSAFLGSMVAFGIALILGILKFYKPNPILHNFTELFVYSGIAAIFSPVMSLMAVSILLILISIYDAIAVWKTKHMIKMAKFQAKSSVFPGLLVPYGKKKTAVLGGGDIGFTLLFSGVVLLKMGFVEALICSVLTSVSLLLLLTYGKKNRFYPAMPFLSVGCFLGLLISFLL